MRVIRQRLQEMVPGMRVFLDVEDLEDISNLQDYILRSECVVVYCSEGYFKSKNCMIELRAAVMLGKHIQPIIDLDPDRGGLTEDEVCNQLLAADAHYEKWGLVDGPRGAALSAKLFERKPIEWNRIGPFQDVTMRMIAAVALGEEKAARRRTSRLSRLSRRLSRSAVLKSAGSDLDAAERTCPFYLEGEVARTAVVVPAPEASGRKFHCFISSSNPGAPELLAEVAEKIKVDLKTTTDISDLPASSHMLLYLTGETWTGGTRSDSFTEDVKAAVDAGTHLLLAHEMPGMPGDGQDARHGVEFATFFSCSDGATPVNLLKANIYGQIAVALKGGPWREASMVLIAQGIASGMVSKEVEPLSPSAESMLAVPKAAFKVCSDAMRRSAAKNANAPQALVGLDVGSTKSGLATVLAIVARARSLRAEAANTRRTRWRRGTKWRRDASDTATDIGSNSQQAGSSQVRCGAKSPSSEGTKEAEKSKNIIARASKDEAGSSSAHAVARPTIATTTPTSKHEARAVTKTLSAPRALKRTFSAPRPGLRRNVPAQPKPRPAGQFAEPALTLALNSFPCLSQPPRPMSFPRNRSEKKNARVEGQMEAVVSGRACQDL
jgi:hypothetical protein